MQQRGLAELPEHGFVPVDRLQQQEVGDFGDAAAARLRQACSERLATLMQEALQFTDVAGQEFVAATGEAWRDEGIVQQQLLVGATLAHPEYAERRPGVGGVALAHEFQAQVADLDQRLLRIGEGVVRDPQLADHIAREAAGVFARHVGLQTSRPAQGHAEHDEFVPDIGAELERQGGDIVGRKIEGRAVGEKALRPRERDLAERQGGFVDDETDEAPRMAGERADASFDEPFEMAVMLLQVLRLQEHAFRPESLAVPGHGARPSGLRFFKSPGVKFRPDRSFAGDVHGARFDTDADRLFLVRHDVQTVSPPCVLQVAKGSDDAQVAGVGLQLALEIPFLSGAQQELLARHRVGAQGLALVVPQSEEVGTVECGGRLQLEQPEHDRRGSAPAVGVERVRHLQCSDDDGRFGWRCATGGKEQGGRQEDKCAQGKRFTH